MVSCHHEEALNFKLMHKRANKSLSDVDRVAQWFTAEYLINQIAIKTDCGVATHEGVPIFALTIEVDLESTRMAVLYNCSTITF